MKLKEAKELALRLRAHEDLIAHITRILPGRIDPAKENDNGWDVSVTVKE